MRSSELLGLQWGDIDWNGDTVHVQRNLCRKKSDEIIEGDNRWWFDSPKTRNSKRAIVISPKLKKALEEA